MDNFQTFSEKCAPRYNISKQEIIQILEILSIVEKHKQSPLEFQRKDKVVIMSENMKTSIIDITKVKTYLLLTKKILEKANNHILRSWKPSNFRKKLGFWEVQKANTPIKAFWHKKKNIYTTYTWHLS